MSDIDCPECQMERIPEGCAMCTACEVEKKWARDVDRLTEALESQRALTRAAAQRAEKAEAQERYLTERIHGTADGGGLVREVLVLQTRAGELEEWQAAMRLASESWRAAAVAWQEWAQRLTGDATMGDEAARAAIAARVATAPELLEALEKLLDAFSDYAEWHGPSAEPSHHRDDCPSDDCPGCALDDETDDAVDAARAAIAKARGTP